MGEGPDSELAHHPRREARSGGVDGLDSGNLVCLIDRHDPVGMDDLNLAVEALDLARDQAFLAARQLAVDVLGRAAKPDEMDEAGLVRGANLEGRAGLSGHEEAVDDDLED